MNTNVGFADPVAAFYDALAPQYDLMTRPGARAQREAAFLARLVCEFHVRTAIDAGSGTGFHALLLRRLGVDVTAVDTSAEMLGIARENAEAEGQQIETVCADLRSLGNYLDDPVDAIVSMGNTLAHMRDASEMKSVLQSFRRLLRPRGVLAIQLLNYDRFLAVGEPIIDDRTVDGIRFVRRSEFSAQKVLFSIEITQPGTPTVSNTVELHPWTLGEMQELFASCGFTEPVCFGSTEAEPFDRARSTNLVLLTQPSS